MSTTHTTNDVRKPTPGQLRYLRDLAMQRGESFATPHTFAQASHEIDRLKQRKRTPRSDVRRELREVSQDMATRRGDAAQVQIGVETRGYGSSATWNTDGPSPSDVAPEPEPAKPAATVSAGTNPPKKLGRYTTSEDGERIICGQRINEVVRLTDVPAHGRGRRFVIERGLTCMAELEAIVSDYLFQAAELDAIPAGSGALTENAA
jgi:hypothetical protein